MPIKKARSQKGPGQVRAASGEDNCSGDDIALLWRVPALVPRAGRHARLTQDLVVVGAFAMIGDVEAFAFLVFAGTQANQQVDQLEQDQRADT